MGIPIVTVEKMKEQFRAAGIAAGDTVLIQSALRPVGNAENGAAGVVAALLDVVGPEGTIVAPAFCFAHEKVENPLIDPANDPSEMGAISETIRRLPGARRSVAYRHSVSAVGKNAAEIVDVDHELSVFDIRSSFGKMLGHDAKVLLLGVTYVNSTTHHFAEYLLQVPDREVVPVPARLALADGTEKAIVVRDYRPKKNEGGSYYAFPHDFNRAGLMLEKSGAVRIARLGNAVTRVFRMRDLVHLFIDNYSVAFNLLAEDKDGPTILPDGEEVSRAYLDGAGRRDIAVWSCVRAADIHKTGGAPSRFCSATGRPFGQRKNLTSRLLAFALLARAVLPLPSFGGGIPDYRMIYDNDGCDMSEGHPDGLPHTVENFYSLRMNRITNTCVRAMFYCPCSAGLGHFTCRKAGEPCVFRNVIVRGKHNSYPAYAAQGTDGLEMAVDFGHAHGIDVWCSIRMNDTHDSYMPFFIPKFKKDNPECLFAADRRRPRCGAWSSLDYANPKVPAFVKTLVRQFCDNYDIDGLNLDFCRHSVFFRSVGRGGRASDEERKAMTQLMRDIRAIADDTARRRGRPFYLAARTQDSVGFLMDIGLDVETWLREHLIDLWSATSYFQLEPWSDSAALAHRYGVRFYASMDESRLRGGIGSDAKGAVPLRSSLAFYAARFAAATAAGADGVYVFNVDDVCAYHGGREVSELLSIDPAAPKAPERFYFATERGSERDIEDCLAGGKSYARTPFLSPVDVRRLTPERSFTFRFEIADERKAASATVEVLADRPDAVSAHVDDVPLEPLGATSGGLARFAVPLRLLAPGLRTFSLSAAQDVTVRDFLLRVML